MLTLVSCAIFQIINIASCLLILKSRGYFARRIHVVTSEWPTRPTTGREPMTSSRPTTQFDRLRVPTDSSMNTVPSRPGTVTSLREDYHEEYDDAVFYRTYQLSYHKFGNMVFFRSRNLYSLCSPGNQDFQKSIYCLIF